MASKPVRLRIQPRGKAISNLPPETSIYIQGSANDLYRRIAAETGTSIHRLRITKGSDGSTIPNDKNITVASTGLGDQSTILVKDLGPQIAWKLVFVIEYLGPLLIHPLVYFLRPYIYTDAPARPSPLQTLSLLLITLHFAKRELETLFVHRFSLATMPVRNIVKNSAHYWLFAGANIAYWTYAPTAPTAGPSNALITSAALALFTVGELGNLNTHLVLRRLRSAGGTERGVPQGLGFGWVTCPNYMFETLAWAGIWMANWSLSTGVFVVLAVGQMALWARKKETRYRKEMPGKYRKKAFAMIPGIW